MLCVIPRTDTIPEQVSKHGRKKRGQEGKGVQNSQSAKGTKRKGVYEGETI
jgi:hypothetical protein